ncbi:uncharacterized protein LOC120001988 [Tripterygium wilfordii]|uniref:uncharacterized protein LOC120001988 n=1 Tax=Tripterygium wilfordii TaxID=458696 RepID=UPI0018F809B4|nr:uncharacterized protein LOC120001988 [Tripterygium wilfordii]
MEDIENIFQRQVIEDKNKARVGKPPTRLQKRAPASLQLDQVTNTINSCLAPMAIPLLSPLVISPPPLTETEEFMFPTNCDGGKATQENMGAPLTMEGGWQHPAVAVYMEPSAIFAFFQSQCVLVDQAR